MNIRKNIDYSEMYSDIDEAMGKNLSQMELYCSIGQAVSARPEKGAAVAAAEYLTDRYLNVRGFCPRNLRRMRDFYRTYEEYPRLMALAMEIGWTQNVVILEADLTMKERAWYLKATCRFGWSKLELIEKIQNEAHKEIILEIGQETCDNTTKETHGSSIKAAVVYISRKFLWLVKPVRGILKRGGRLWRIMSCPIFMEKRTAFIRC